MNSNYDPNVHGELLSAYLDDALDAKESAEVEALLAHSPDARHHFEELVALQNMFQHWEPAKPDAFFLRRVEARLADGEMPSDKRFSLGMKLPKYAVAAMLLLTLGGMAFLSHLRQAQNNMDVEALLHGFWAQDVEQVAVLVDSDVSEEMVLDLILTDNVR